MSYPYGGLTQGLYSNADVMEEMERAGPYGGRRFNQQQAYAYYTPQDAYQNYPVQPPPAFDKQAVLDGARWSQEMYQSGAQFQQQSGPAEFQQQAAAAFQQQDGAAFQPQETMYEGAVDVYFKGEKRIVNHAIVDHRQQIVESVRPVYTFEKVIEVPQVIVKETQREVIKPQIIERIIEVPKPEIREREVVGPPTVQVKEQIVEVPQVHIEERVVHVPRREIQERLIEVPKIEYVERIEYEDYVEYREVPVDKIIEVPEIEYHIREVEYLVPQTYVQEYYIDKYKEVPMTQVQEVHREERVSAAASPQAVQQAQEFMTAAAEAGEKANMQAELHRAQMQASQAYYAQLQQQQAQNYASYDPGMNGAYGSMQYGANPFGSYEQQSPGQERLQAAISGMPLGSTFAVPKGTIKPTGATPPGSMQAIPGYSMSPPTPPAPYAPGSYAPGDSPFESNAAMRRLQGAGFR